jgi:hypothetical protein
MKKPAYTHHRKPLLLGALALGAGLWSARADYPAEVTSRNPIAYYRLNETIATSDTAANAGSLGFVGDGTYGSLVAHPVGGALPSQPANGGGSFFASTEAATAAASCVTVPYQAALNAATPFSFEFWAKPVDAGSRCAAGSIVLGNSGWIFYQNAIVAGQWTFRTLSSVSANQNVSGGTITPGQWQHIVGVWDGVQNILYVNGVQVATAAAASFNPNTTLQLVLGNRSALDYPPFAGGLDEAAYYTNALSAARVLAHYQAGTNAAPATAYDVVVQSDSPVGYWRLNDGTMAVNSGTRGVAANGGYIGATTTGAGPRPAAQSGFDAGNNAATLTSASGSWIGLGTGASLSGTTDFSLSAWVKTTATTEGVIVQQRDASPGGYDGQYRFFMNADGTVHFFVYQGGFQFDFSSSSVVNDGNWHQVVAVRQGADGYVYVDDQLAGSGSGTVKSLNGNFQTYIGRDLRDGVTPFDGSIDEVAIFSSALGQGTVQSLYYTGIGSNTVFLVTDPPTVSPVGTIYATTAFTVTADAGGALPLTYQWRRNGGNVGSPSGSPSYTKVNCSTNDSGNYDVIVSNPFSGSVTSSVVAVNVDPTVVASIGTQPQSVVIYSNYNASFSVEAVGTPPFTYQWKHTGTNLPGATSPTLTLTQCSASQLGSYTVAVTNILGGVLSDPATLAFITPASLYEATVTGKRPWAYWRLNEGSGTTATNIGLVSVVSNVVGAAASATYGPDLTPFTADLQSPAFAGMESGNTVTVFPGTAANTPNPYGSIDAGTESSLSGTNDFTLMAWIKISAIPSTEIALVQQRDESGAGYVGQYRFFIRTDGKLEFFVYGPNIFGANENIQFDATSSATITDGNWHLVSATRQGLTGYIHVDGIQVGSATGTEMKALNSARKIYIGRDGRDPAFLAGLNGSLDEVAIFARALSIGEVQEIFSIGKYASVLTPAFVTQQPAPLTRYAGASATFSVVAGGSAPLTYRWRKNGISIADATNASVTLTGVTAANAGNYSCTVSNALPVGAVSSNAALTVITLPAGTYGAKVGALGPLAYWRLNETNSEAAAADLVGGHNGTYEGVITQGVAGPTNVSFDAGNTACFFDGSVPSDLSCGSIGAMDGYTDFTVALWVRTTDTTASSLISQRDSTPVGYNGSYKLSMLANGNLDLTVYRLEDGGSQFGGTLATASTPVNDGAWHHVVAMRQGTNGFIYVDGVLAASASGAAVASLRSSTLTYIGRDQRDNNQPLTGDLDEIALFNRALTPAEVANIAPAVIPPVVSISRSGTDAVVTWDAGSLLEATNVTGPWTMNSAATSPYTVPATNSTMFFRAQRP